MELIDIKKRMKVRVSETLKETDKRWGLNSGMRILFGAICTVESIGSLEVYVRHRNGYAHWIHPADVTVVSLTQKIKPVMFDPKNIIE